MYRAAARLFVCVLAWHTYIELREEEVLDYSKDLAILVKAHNRPNCAISLVKSLRQCVKLRDVRVYISDDGDEPLEEAFGEELKHLVQFVRNGVDEGVSKGRNDLVKVAAAAGYKYVYMSDEDYLFPSYGTFKALSKHFIEADADIMALTRCDGTFDCKRGRVADLRINGKVWIFSFRKRNFLEKLGTVTCQKSDLVQQVFLAKTEALLHSPWDPVLKNNDHYDFMFNARKNGLQVYACPSLHVPHRPRKCSDRSPYDPYMRVRIARWQSLIPYFLTKWDIEVFVDEMGHQWENNGQQVDKHSHYRTIKW
jgi:GT2 family glycosyltransferase